jgi:hypothetical protein
LRVFAGGRGRQDARWATSRAAVQVDIGPAVLELVVEADVMHELEGLEVRAVGRRRLAASPAELIRGGRSDPDMVSDGSPALDLPRGSPRQDRPSVLVARIRHMLFPLFPGFYGLALSA